MLVNAPAEAVYPPTQLTVKNASARAGNEAALERELLSSKCVQVDFREMERIG